MIHVSLLYSGIRFQVVLGQRIVYLLSHLHVPVTVRCLNQQEEQIQLRSLNVLCLQVCDYFENLDEAEILFTVVLHPQGA